MKAKKKNGIKWTNFIGLFFAGIINACGVGLFLVPFGIVYFRQTNWVANFPLVSNIELSILYFSL